MNEPIILDWIHSTCYKRMALTREGFERGKDWNKDWIYEQVEKIVEEANKMHLDWSLIDISLQIKDNRYTRALLKEKDDGVIFQKDEDDE